MGTSNLNRAFSVLDLSPESVTWRSTVPGRVVFRITIHYETMKHNQSVNAPLNPDVPSASEARTYVINHDPLAYRFAVSTADFLGGVLR
jgi:hypothetical protein